MLAYDAATDGCFPLITNDTALSDAQALAAYRYQPNLECRHHLLKSVQDAAPILLRSPARIEALFCCQFLTLLLGALIERQIRTAMAAANAHDLPLHPELGDHLEDEFGEQAGPVGVKQPLQRAADPVVVDRVDLAGVV